MVLCTTTVNLKGRYISNLAELFLTLLFMKLGLRPNKLNKEKKVWKYHDHVPLKGTLSKDNFLIWHNIRYFISDINIT